MSPQKSDLGICKSLVSQTLTLGTSYKQSRLALLTGSLDEASSPAHTQLAPVETAECVLPSHSRREDSSGLLERRWCRFSQGACQVPWMMVNARGHKRWPVGRSTGWMVTPPGAWRLLPRPQGKVREGRDSGSRAQLLTLLAPQEDVWRRH